VAGATKHPPGLARHVLTSTRLQKHNGDPISVPILFWWFYKTAGRFESPCGPTVQRERLVFFLVGRGAFFFAGAAFRRVAAFCAGFFAVFTRFAGFLGLVAGFVAGLAEAARALIGDLVRAARVLSFSSVFSSASNSSG